MINTKKKHLIAVYGSLIKGLHNHDHYLKDAKFVGSFDSEPIYTLYDISHFPGLKMGGHTSVKMEVYEIDNTDLQRIDYLEGYSNDKDKEYNHYTRTSIKTPYGYAYTYLYNQSVKNLTVVKNGDWKDYYKTKTILHV